MLVSCNPNPPGIQQENNKVAKDKCFTYPREIDSLHLQDLYDSARWYIYTRYCDVLYKPKSDSVLSKSFGELELKFDNMLIKNDTAALIFNFADMGTPLLSNMLRDSRPLATGVGFDIKTRQKVYMISSNTTITSKGDPTSRYENPLQPEVIRYIKENWKKLDDCFRELAEKKGLRPKS